MGAQFVSRVGEDGEPQSFYYSTLLILTSSGRERGPGDFFLAYISTLSRSLFREHWLLILKKKVFDKRAVINACIKAPKLGCQVGRRENTPFGRNSQQGET